MSKYKKTTKETYNTISKDWETKRKYYWKPITQFLSSFQNAKKLTMLDLGCGTGRHLELAKKLGFQNKNTIGADYSSGQLEIVKQKGFQTKLTNLENLDFKDSSFDIIICIAAHHHLLKIEEQLKSLQEINRILKPNGQILLSNWFPEKKFTKEQEKKGKFEFIDKDKQKVKVTYTYNNEKLNRYYYLFKQKELENLCKKANLKITKQEFNKGNLYLTMIKD